MKAVVAAFNQEKALVGAFSVITNLRMELFQALLPTCQHSARTSTRHAGGDQGTWGSREIKNLTSRGCTQVKLRGLSSLWALGAAGVCVKPTIGFTVRLQHLIKQTVPSSSAVCTVKITKTMWNANNQLLFLKMP